MNIHSETGSLSTVVTACDSKFVWGAMLLGLSMRYQGMSCAYHIVGYDLSQAELSCLNSIPNTKVFLTRKTDSRSVCTQKPGAISTAETEIIVWMDADCLVSGNLEPLFTCPDNTIQIRWRGEEENASVYRDLYQSRDKWGSIPQQVLKIWQTDIADLASSRIKTVCQTNCFVLNRTHLPFVQLWQEQMEKVLPQSLGSVYAKDSIAYSMTDESVINSLFAYSSVAPRTSSYLMDKDPQAACLHFGLNPKPWIHWTNQSLNHYDYVMDLLRWAPTRSIRLPAMPNSFLREYKKREIIRAKADFWYRKARYTVSSHLRKLQSKLG